jgi:hypothetical protein
MKEDMSVYTLGVIRAVITNDQYLEHFIQAIPCYIFFVAFIVRYKETRDIGLARRIYFGWLLTLKIALSIALILLRIL